MNRSALKSYAPRARLDFIRAVTDRAAFYGVFPDRIDPITESGDVVLIGGRAFPRVVSIQRRALVDRIQEKGFDQVIEAMAYTWFNRFVALRYMELHGYLDHGYRVLSPAPDLTTETQRALRGEKEINLRDLRASVVTTPEILDHAEHVTLPGLDAQQVINLKLDGTKEAELYRLLLVAQCNALHEAMPFLFEKIADDTELLLPDNLLHTDSVIRKLVNEIEEADWQQVEIIGWLYQFYISDKKDEVIGKVVKSEDIPAATQLFTPNWIVKYLVQNTLGRQWLATYPDSPLRQQMQYYIEPAEQTDEVKAQLAAITPKTLDPETLTLLDDACGSGHILVEAYDLFKAIYQERGYRSKDIPRLILEKNLFGLEIDDRAAQLAAFALLMKARADERRIFADCIQPNVVAIQESKGLEELFDHEGKGLFYHGDTEGTEKEKRGKPPFVEADLFPQTVNQPLPQATAQQQSPLSPCSPCLRGLIKLFEYGKTFGSLIRVPPDLAAQLPAARQQIEAMVATGQLWENRAATLLLPLLKQAEMLARTYDTVVTNPPYMGGKSFNPMLKQFISTGYTDGKGDLYAAFMERSLLAVHPGGLVGAITMRSWMFLPTFQELRTSLIENQTTYSLVHIGYNSFPELNSKIALAAAFCFQHSPLPKYVGTYVNLNHAPQTADKQQVFREDRKTFLLDQNEFKRIPGSRFAFWASEKVKQAFDRHQTIEMQAPVRQGFQTGDNDTFLRYWHEVDREKVLCSATRKEDVFSQNKKWVPYHKGGAFRKWYGNHDYVVAFDRLSYDILLQSGNCLPSRHLYFKEGITWSALTSSSFGARYSPSGFTFSAKGACAFPNQGWLEYTLALLNSNVAEAMLDILAATLDFNVGSIREIPLIDLDPENRESLERQTRELIELSSADWDSHECSWDFHTMPLLDSRFAGRKLIDAFHTYSSECSSRIERARNLEAENNRLLAGVYDLRGELASDVTTTEIVLHRASETADSIGLVSYSIGCMMGRYSLDKPGLVYAHSRNEGFDASQYQAFPADADGIIPITELAWFSDDATERFVKFIAKAWPREHLEENLKFIADSLGPNRDEHPRDTIRRYLATGFFKDHLQTYKKRPIYWLFASGKQRAFQCLVYLHRYHEGTLARMRTEYVIPLQGKIAHRIEQLAGDITAATSTSHRRKLEKEKESLVKQSTELAAFDEKLRHYADQRIALDLDDGVKVNYGKFGDLLAEAKAVTGGGEE